MPKNANPMLLITPLSSLHHPYSKNTANTPAKAATLTPARPAAPVGTGAPVVVDAGPVGAVGAVNPGPVAFPVVSAPPRDTLLVLSVTTTVCVWLAVTPPLVTTLDAAPPPPLDLHSSEPSCTGFVLMSAGFANVNSADPRWVPAASLKAWQTMALTSVVAETIFRPQTLLSSGAG